MYYLNVASKIHKVWSDIFEGTLATHHKQRQGQEIQDTTSPFNKQSVMQYLLIGRWCMNSCRGNWIGTEVAGKGIGSGLGKHGAGTGWRRPWCGTAGTGWRGPWCGRAYALGYMLLFEKGGAARTGAVADCFGTAPVSGPGTLAATADGFGVTLPRMKSILHLTYKISTWILLILWRVIILFTLVEIDWRHTLYKRTQWNHKWNVKLHLDTYRCSWHTHFSQLYLL